MISPLLNCLSIHLFAKCALPVSESVADQGEGPGRPGSPPYFSTKMKPEGPKKIFLETAPLLSGSG